MNLTPVHQRLLPLLADASRVGTQIVLLAFLGIFGHLSLEATPLVIIKADDLRYNASTTVSANWQRFADYIEEKKIKASIGIIADSLETAGDDYYEWIRDIDRRGWIEFWHHGYDHKRDGSDPIAWWEFKNTDYAFQKEHFEKSMSLAEEKLGFLFRTFGAPYNQTDATTVQVLEENSDIKVWLYGDDSADTSKLVLKRFSAVNIEVSTGVPDFDLFKANFPTYLNEEVLVIQGHPGQWDESKLLEFSQIVDYVLEQGASFTTPYEYYETLYPSGVYHLELKVDSEEGIRYQWRRSNNLTDWEPWGTQFIGTGDTMIQSVIHSGTDPIFYACEAIPADAPLLIYIRHR